MPSWRRRRQRNSAPVIWPGAWPALLSRAGQKERIVISEFPSYESAVAAYNSPDYQAALKALGDGAVRDIRILEGLE